MGTLTQELPSSPMTTFSYQSFSGTYARNPDPDLEPLGVLELLEIDLYRHETGHIAETVLWHTRQAIAAGDLVDDYFSTPLPDIPLVNEDYCWRVRLRDDRGTWTAWVHSAASIFSVALPAPTLVDSRPFEIVAGTPVVLPVMSGFRVSAVYYDGQGNRPSKLSVQLVTQVAAETWQNADYSGDAPLWTHLGPSRYHEYQIHGAQVAYRIGARYAGQTLTEGLTYLWRMRVAGISGTWSNYVGGSFTLLDRTVPGTGPVETVTDTWKELWRTTIVNRPVGLWYDPQDTGNIRVLDRQRKYLTVIVQADRSTGDAFDLSSVVTYPAGLSGDPGDNAVFWVLSAPWSQGVSGNSHVKCLNRITFAVVHDFNVGTGHYSALKVSGNWIYLTNYGTGEIERYDKTTGALNSAWGITYESVLQTKPTGIMVDGTTLYYFFVNDGTTRRFLLATEANPDVVSGVRSTEGTFLLGGEMDTTTHTEMYGDQDTDNLVAKFTLTEPQFSDGTPASRLRVAQTTYADA